MIIPECFTDNLEYLIPITSGLGISLLTNFYLLWRVCRKQKKSTIYTSNDHTPYNNRDLESLEVPYSNHLVDRIKGSIPEWARQEWLSQHK